MSKRFFVLLALAFVSSHIFAAPAAQTPALQVFQQWLDAFNTGDRARIAAFWQQYGGGRGPDRVNDRVNDRVKGDLGLRDMTGGMSIFRVVEGTETHVTVIMKEMRGAWSESTLDLSSVDPPVVARMGGHPTPPPEEMATPAANDADLATETAAHAGESRGPDTFSGALLVAHDGKVELEKAWGMADSAHQIPNTVDTQFCIGSMNKMLTAVAVLQLVQQGKLQMDKPIAAWWPDYPNHDLASRVTVRELLSHSGGTGDIFTPEYEAHRAQVRSLGDYVRLFGNRPVAFEPGTRMEYSNYGFILLGRLVELVSGLSYQDYVRQHIFLPAGMTHSDSRPEVDHVSGRAIGYSAKPTGLIPNTDTMPWSGTSAGGGYSTVHDLFLFARALEAGKLLSAAMLEEATRPSKTRDDYGLGFYVLPGGGYGHGGGAAGVNGELHILPRSGYIIVALANRDPRMATDLVDYITSILPRSVSQQRL
jgi:D-alanyl-D-alanine carboxypeptidase